MKGDQTYCVKCKKAVSPKDLKLEHDSRGRARVCGHCPKCHTATYKYVPQSMASPKRKRVTSPKRRKRVASPKRK